MKKLAFTVLAFALASFAGLDAQTITKTVSLRNAAASYAPDGKGGWWASNSHIRLGNRYEGDAYYTQFNIYEIDFSSESFASIDSISCKNLRDFNTPSYGVTEIPEDLAAFSIEILAGGTGDAKADYEASSLKSVAKLTGLTIKDFVDGSVKLDGLGLDMTGESYFTFMISVDETLEPQLDSDGMATETMTSFFRITLTGTQAIPEPSTYAAIFGALALGFAISRRIF